MEYRAYLWQTLGRKGNCEGIKVSYCIIYAICENIVVRSKKISYPSIAFDREFRLSFDNHSAPYSLCRPVTDNVRLHAAHYIWNYDMERFLTPSI